MSYVYNTDVSNVAQQVAVEDFVSYVGCISPQLLPMAMSTTLIGNYRQILIIMKKTNGDCIIGWRFVS